MHLCEYILFSGKYVLHFLLIWCCYVCILPPFSSLLFSSFPCSTFITCVCVMLAYKFSVYINFFRADFRGEAVRQIVSFWKYTMIHEYTLTHATPPRSIRADALQFCYKSKIMDWLLGKDHLWNKLQTKANITHENKFTSPGKWRRISTSVTVTRIRF